MKTIRYHILLALAGRPLHGAEIRRRVEEQSDGSVTPYPAILYGTLDELSEDGLIVEEASRPLASDQVRWRFYALTPVGRRALEAETARLGSVVERARAALGIANSG